MQSTSDSHYVVRPLYRAVVYYTPRDQGADTAEVHLEYGPYDVQTLSDIFPTYWGVTESDMLLAEVPENARESARIVFYDGRTGKEYPYGDPRLHHDDFE